MSEQDMRGRVTKALRALDAIAVENPVLPGTPDVNYLGGWIELKWLRMWPRNEDTVIHLKHFSAQQRVWHLRRRRAGGSSWLLLQCKREWFLFDGATAALNIGLCTHSQLITHATKHWDDGLNEEELKLWLTSRVPNVFLLNGEDETKLKRLLQNDTVFRSVDT